MCGFNTQSSSHYLVKTLQGTQNLVMFFFKFMWPLALLYIWRTQVDRRSAQAWNRHGIWMCGVGSGLWWDCVQRRPAVQTRWIETCLPNPWSSGGSATIIILCCFMNYFWVSNVEVIILQWDMVWTCRWAIQCIFRARGPACFCTDYSFFFFRNKCIFGGLNDHEKSWNLAHMSGSEKNVGIWIFLKWAWPMGSGQA